MIFAAALALSISIQAAADSSALNPLGTWRTSVDDGLIRIERCGEDLCGHVAGSAKLTARPSQMDIRNHDPALRSRLIMGLWMMKVKQLGPDRWGDGWIYDPNNGGTFTARFEIASDGRLRFTGCMNALLCQTQVWTRAG